jgi:ABC-2 type transport system permease protein
MVEPATMPGWLQVFVKVNPVSLMATAMRGLMDGGVTTAQVLRALIAPAVLTLVLAPVTLLLYRRR